MWPDRVSNPGPLTYESGVLPTALRGPAPICEHHLIRIMDINDSSLQIISLNNADLWIYTK